MAKKRTPEAIKTRGARMVTENAAKLPSKQRKNLGGRSIYHVNNDAAQQDDRKKYEEFGGVRRGNKA